MNKINFTLRNSLYNNFAVFLIYQTNQVTSSLLYWKLTYQIQSHSFPQFPYSRFPSFISLSHYHIIGLALIHLLFFFFNITSSENFPSLILSLWISSSNYQLSLPCFLNALGWFLELENCFFHLYY